MLLSTPSSRYAIGLSALRSAWGRLGPWAVAVLLALWAVTGSEASFQVDRSPIPSYHHDWSPSPGEPVRINPPPFVWRDDERAASYRLELSQTKDFSGAVIAVDDIPMAFYNHDETLEEGTWYWRYFVVNEAGEVSFPSPVRDFDVPADFIALPVPPFEEILASMPDHPRIYVTPDKLEEFRARRKGVAASAWDHILREAENLLGRTDRVPSFRIPLEEADVGGSPHTVRRTDRDRPGPVRRQVFWLAGPDEAYWLPREGPRPYMTELANRADVLSLAYQISGQERFAEEARDALVFLAPFRIDYHLRDNLRARGGHDTVVYAYETGLRSAAIAYDRLFHRLAAEEREAIVAHIAYHSEAAVEWLRRSEIHLRYENSHANQCMHPLAVTLLATAKSSPEIDEMLAYILPQYFNRLPFTTPDGGYSEGQTYGHKFRWNLELLAAIHSATGVDLFQKPDIRNAGRFWLYAMWLNYWFQHWGDGYSLIWSHPNNSDAYIANFLAAMTRDPYVKWYAETVVSNPEHIPMQYLSAVDLEARPPVDIPQARLFPDTGVVSAYDRFYDHRSARVFFRSSPAGGGGHRHADQNSFVIHDGAEILAPHTGYYTYFGDAYDRNWSKATFSKNSMLFNGKGQPWHATSQGRIPVFFHGSDITYMVGDASDAYEEPLETFHRAFVFIRPDLYLVFDELEAAEAGTYSWLLNVFSEPAIDPEGRTLVVPQQDMRLRVDHVFPEDMTYTADNERPYPIRDPSRPWSRYTEAFPQPWHIRASNRDPAPSMSFLTVMQSYPERDGPRFEVTDRHQDEQAAAVSFQGPAGESGTALFRRKLFTAAPLDALGVQASAQAAVVRRTGGAVGDLLIVDGKTLALEGRLLWRSTNPVSVQWTANTPVAAGLVRIDGRPGNILLAMPDQPGSVWVTEGDNPAEAVPLPFEWQEDTLSFTLEENGSHTVWIDPVVDLRHPIPEAVLTVHDPEGTYELTLESAWDERGQWVFFTQMTPRLPAQYRFRAADSGTPSHTLLQDRWDPVHSRFGRGTMEGRLRDGSELFFHVPPAADGAPIRFEAHWSAPYPDPIVNVLRNGNFEEGIPAYPPRGWTVTLGRTQPDDMSWAEWTQADAVQGRSSLRFYQEQSRPRRVTAQPLRLRSSGLYQVRFEARGDLEGAQMVVRGAGGRTVSVPIETSSEWQSYRAEVELEPGYTTLQITIPGGDADRELWVDEVQLGLFAPGVED